MTPRESNKGGSHFGLVHRNSNNCIAFLVYQDVSENDEYFSASGQIVSIRPKISIGLNLRQSDFKINLKFDVINH